MAKNNKVGPSDSLTMQFAVVFVMVAAFILVAYAARTL